MPSAWIRSRPTKSGGVRYRVEYRLGGRATPVRYAGSFKRKADADERRRWITGELAGRRVPDLGSLEATGTGRTLRSVFEGWRESRIDVDEATATTYRTSQERVLAAIGNPAVQKVDVALIVRLVSTLHENGAARESIRKTRSHLAMALDHAGITPNPVRDKSVRLPRKAEVEMVPPLADHVAATFHALASKYRLPHLVYDACGMRLTELELLEWRDVDEQGRRWRIRKETTKTRRARWLPFERFPNPDGVLVFEAVSRLVPREDRDPFGRVFAGFGGDAYRTELGRACKAAAVPLFTPNDLRHRRATLWHLGGVPVADAASWLGHSAHEHLETYAHATLDDRGEAAYPGLLFELGCSHGAVPGAVLDVENVPISRHV